MEVEKKVIVLKKFQHSESDLIIHTLSSHGEKIHLIAKGALKSRRRFTGGVLEPSHYIHINYKKSKRDGLLHILNEAHLLEAFLGIRREYERLEMAFYFLKKMAQVSLEGTSNCSHHFHLLGQSLRSLETTKNLDKLKTFFEAKLLQQQGILPHQESLVQILCSPIKDHEQIEIAPKKWQEAKSLIQYTMQTHLVNSD